MFEYSTIQDNVVHVDRGVVEIVRFILKGKIGRGAGRQVMQDENSRNGNIKNL